MSRLARVLAVFCTPPGFPGTCALGTAGDFPKDFPRWSPE